VCLTEGEPDLCPPNGYTITSSNEHGYTSRRGGQRKVLLWSQQEWDNVDEIGNSGLPPGRYISGVTDTNLGPLRIIGVCIPWSHAHVSTGRRDRQLWQDHLTFLEELESLLNRRSDDIDTIVVGDFNQRIPPTTCTEDCF